MPHLIVEHDKNLDSLIEMNTLSKGLHKCLAKQETVKLENIKTRTITASNVVIGDNQKKHFIHITLLLLPGRSEDLKKTIGERLLEKTESILKESNIEVKLTSLSLQITDLNHYYKS